MKTVKSIIDSAFNQNLDPPLQVIMHMEKTMQRDEAKEENELVFQIQT